MKIKSNLKAGQPFPPGPTGQTNNHNQTVTRSLKVKSGVKAGGILVHA